jgi:hypothetical protein
MLLNPLKSELEQLRRGREELPQEGWTRRIGDIHINNSNYRRQGKD